MAMAITCSEDNKDCNSSWSIAMVSVSRRRSWSSSTPVDETVSFKMARRNEVGRASITFLHLIQSLISKRLKSTAKCYEVTCYLNLHNRKQSIKRIKLEKWMKMWTFTGIFAIPRFVVFVFCLLRFDRGVWFKTGNWTRPLNSSVDFTRNEIGRHQKPNELQHYCHSLPTVSSNSSSSQMWVNFWCGAVELFMKFGRFGNTALLNY